MRNEYNFSKGIRGKYFGNVAHRVLDTSRNPTGCHQVFISYSRKDQASLERLLTLLKPLKYEHLIDVWHDQEIEAGQMLDSAILKQLNTAQIILLLISPDFLASKYCYTKEMKRALERHRKNEAQVIPIIVRSCDWLHSPFHLLHALPKDGEPISKWPDPEEAFLDVAREIRRVVEKWQGGSNASNGE